jgi:hypothetical protein
MFLGDLLGVLVRLQGSLLRELRLLVGAQVVIHAVRSSSSFMRMSSAKMNLSSVYVFRCRHCLFLKAV